MNIYEDITLIIVAYRSEKLILRNLKILKRLKVIIVDNSNSDKLPSIIGDYKNIKLIKSKKNLGYGKAVNLGFKFVNTSFILTVNPDLILEENQIKRLLNVFLEDQNNIGILAPSLLDDKMNNRSHGSISYIEKLKHKKILQSSNNIAVGNICCKFLWGSCFLIKKDFFKMIGGFDEKFFMYFEDNDLCDRALKTGKYIMETPFSKFVHLQNSSYEKKLFTESKLSIIHKVSSYLYLKKNTNYSFLFFQLFKNFFDYFQRMIFNFLILRLKKSYKNLLRLISIFLYITKSYNFFYKIWKL